MACPASVFALAAKALTFNPSVQTDRTVIQDVSPTQMQMNAHNIQCFGISQIIPATVWYNIQSMGDFKIQDIIRLKKPSGYNVNVKTCTTQVFDWAFSIFRLINSLSFPWDFSANILEIWFTCRCAQTTDTTYKKIPIPRSAEAKIELFNLWFRRRALAFEQLQDCPHFSHIQGYWDEICQNNSSIYASCTETEKPTTPSKGKPSATYAFGSCQSFSPNRSGGIGPEIDKSKWFAQRKICEAANHCYIWNFYPNCKRNLDRKNNTCTDSKGGEPRKHTCFKCQGAHRFIEKHKRDVEH